jgi:hypothetical protein
MSEIEEPVQVMEEAGRRLSPIFPVLEGMGIAAYKRDLTTFAPDGAYLIGPCRRWSASSPPQDALLLALLVLPR